jgi:hypothetical protein
LLRDEWRTMGYGSRTKPATLSVRPSSDRTRSRGRAGRGANRADAGAGGPLAAISWQARHLGSEATSCGSAGAVPTSCALPAVDDTPMPPARQTRSSVSYGSRLMHSRRQFAVSAVPILADMLEPPPSQGVMAVSGNTRRIRCTRAFRSTDERSSQFRACAGAVMSETHESRSPIAGEAECQGSVTAAIASPLRRASNAGTLTAAGGLQRRPYTDNTGSVLEPRPRNAPSSYTGSILLQRIMRSGCPTCTWLWQRCASVQCVCTCA